MSTPPVQQQPSADVAKSWSQVAALCDSNEEEIGKEAGEGHARYRQAPEALNVAVTAGYR